jgi:hypothetical protein
MALMPLTTISFTNIKKNQFIFFKKKIFLYQLSYLNHLVLAVDMSSGNNLQLAVLSVALLRDELIAVLLEQLLHFSAISGVLSKQTM